MPSLQKRKNDISNLDRKRYSFLLIYIITAFGYLFQGCTKQKSTLNATLPASDFIQIHTDKAVYEPGEKVQLTISDLPPNTSVRYYHLNEMLKEEPLKALNWSWTPPPLNFQGYLVEVYQKISDGTRTIATVAVDVSSDWTRYPRYGFLSKFDNLPENEMDSIMLYLNRLHLNGIQFYDWHFDHHRPLAGSVSSPQEQWKDIANRTIDRKTVSAYIQKCKELGMKTMFYNLCYGALNNASADGVKPEWFMYKDAFRAAPDVFLLPKPPFRSDIFFLNAANTQWQAYLANRNDDVYAVFPFDGYHVDQIGDRGIVYDYNGNRVNIAASFQPFLQHMKTAHPTKRLVMNAVNQYGQQNSIAHAPVDFLYSEVWGGNESYKDLASIILNNSIWSGGKSTVLAAYVNYRRAESPGYFNNPGVLLANAVIFAFGGAHLEMGEHLLGKEYFPNNNLKMNQDLKNTLINYYDFLCAYQNLLRDAGSVNENPSIHCTNNKMNLSGWPPRLGSVSTHLKKTGNRTVIHFINFTNAVNLDWRDTDANYPSPETISGAEIEVPYNDIVHRVWVASPDYKQGTPQLLNFKQITGKIKIILPDLKYWHMLVIE